MNMSKERQGIANQPDHNTILFRKILRNLRIKIIWYNVVTSYAVLR